MAGRNTGHGAECAQFNHPVGQMVMDVGVDLGEIGHARSSFRLVPRVPGYSARYSVGGVELSGSAPEAVTTTDWLAAMANSPPWKRMIGRWKVIPRSRMSVAFGS